MADNITIPGLGVVRTKEQGDLSHIQVVCLFGPSGEIIPVSGTTGLGVHVKVIDGVTPVSGPLTDAQLRASVVPVILGAAANAGFTVVAANSSSVQLRPATAARKGLIVFNDATTPLRVFYGTPASTENVSYPPVPAGGYFEMPGPVPYSGQITGIWELDDSAEPTGNARITELT